VEEGGVPGVGVVAQLGGEGAGFGEVEWCGGVRGADFGQQAVALAPDVRERFLQEGVLAVAEGREEPPLRSG
jgi:hypothetical protein